MKIELLDCTLRDGGYINDWNFGHDKLVNLFERITDAGVEYIELGFLDDRREFDINRSIMPNTECMAKIYGGLPKGNTELIGMIDYGTCDIKNIQPKSESILDGIRVIFKKHLRVQALDYCRQLKELGYKVFAQLVSITSYDDEELMDLIRLANEIEPYAVSMVDTYGLLHKSTLFHYYDLLEANLKPSIRIGYHAHNNFQLGYSNCIELMGYHQGKERGLLCDGTVYGMGKSAGNAPSELLAMYMNANYGKQYHISQLLEAIDCNLMDIFKVTPWGYNLKFFIAASNDCHPNYVTYLLEKQNLSIKAINSILRQIEGEKKLLYDKQLIEQLYVDYQRNEYDDTENYAQLKKELEGKSILIIGPGASIVNEKDKITQYIETNYPVVISINLVPKDWEIHYLFLTNSKRYVQQSTAISRLSKDVKLIATSNITRASGDFDYVMNYEPLIDRSVPFMDNSFIMLLKVLAQLHVNHIAMAGLDGYSLDKENYFSSKMEYDHIRKIYKEINAYVDNYLAKTKDKQSYEFITKTFYNL